MDTPQGTFYRVYFDIYLTLDGSEFNAELVCQGEVLGRCTARFRQRVFCEEKKVGLAVYDDNLRMVRGISAI